MILTAEAEFSRLAALESYQLMDTPPEPALDQVTAFAAHLFQVPIALITLVDRDRIWFKSAYGTSLREMPRAVGLCATTLLTDGINVIEDGARDERTRNHLMVTEMGFRFYAGIAIHSPDGHAIGTLCLVAKRPRLFSAADRELLTRLSRLVEEQLQLKLDVQRSIKSQHQFTSMLAHSLKNALTIFPTCTTLIEEEAKGNQDLLFLNERIRKAADHMLLLVKDTLDMSFLQTNLSDLRLSQVDINRCVARVAAGNRMLAKQKSQKLFVNNVDEMVVMGDEMRVTEILENLVNNAIKYSPFEAPITINVYQQDGSAVVEVKDEGPGLSPQDFAKLFQPFNRLSATPTGGESSSGVGLATAKLLTDAHGGTLTAMNNEEGAGATFTLHLPLHS